jgi:release factor glutamine methyltransferase
MLRPRRLDLERESPPATASIKRMTVLEVLQSTAAYFKKRKIDNPRLNAEHLLAHVLDRGRIELYLEFERALGESELATLRELVRRRGRGEPLQHLLGTVEFCGQTFLCDKRALVPRPETEELVELLTSKLQLPSSNFRVIDVGTGSGVIALSLAARFREAEIYASDISEQALALARENALRLNFDGRVQFLRSNLLEGVDGMFDLIVANLPYIAAQDRHTLSREVLHDPQVALFAAEQGAELLRKLIEQTPARLRPGGMLALEIGAGQSEALLSILADKNYRDISSRNDYSGRTRFLFARYG